MASDRIILWEDYAIIRRSHDDHHRIAKALRAGDGERAGRIMHEHVIFAGEVLCAISTVWSLHRIAGHPASRGSTGASRNETVLLASLALRAQGSRGGA